MGDLIQLKASFQAIPPTALEEREVAYNFPLNALFFGTDDDGIQAGYLSGRSDAEWEQYLDGRYSPSSHNHAVITSTNTGSVFTKWIYENTDRSSKRAFLDTDGRCKYFYWQGSYLGVQVDNTWVGWNVDISDSRFKENIQSRDSEENWMACLNGLLNIGLYSYDWREESISSGHVSLGIIAQDLQAVNPDLVTTDFNGFLHVDVNACIVQLVAAIKGLNAKVEALQGQLSNETN